MKLFLAALVTGLLAYAFGYRSAIRVYRDCLTANPGRVCPAWVNPQ